MTLLQDVRATMPDLRAMVPEFRAAMPDLREVVPELRAAMPDLRESLSDLRADLPPGPWSPKRPSVVRRIAIIIVAGLAVLGAAWLVSRYLERRRLAVELLSEDDMAADRAEGEGMAMPFGSPATWPLGADIDQPVADPRVTPSREIGSMVDEPVADLVKGGRTGGR